MLLNLNVKNLALIDQAEVAFADGLNILTGETGAGKSMLLGSLQLAFGGKLEKSALKDETKEVFVEAVFQIENEKQSRCLQEMEIFPEEGQVILSRKYVNGRWINKINGESVTVKLLQQVSEVLIDIYGQHQQQILLNKHKHLELLDEYAEKELKEEKEKLASSFKEYTKLKKELEESGINEEQRMREISFMEFEVKEIEEAALRLGEDEELEAAYRKMNNAKKIAETMDKVHKISGYSEEQGAGEQIGYALRLLDGIAGIDKELEDKRNQLADIDGLLNDFNRDIAQYMESLEFREEEFVQTEERLDLLNKLKAKYGKTLEEVLQYCQEKQKELERLADYDNYRAELKRNLERETEKLKKVSAQVSKIRRKKAEELCQKVKEHLLDLNFLNTDFTMEFKESTQLSQNGIDEVQFMIATNLNEPLRPLQTTASGGELSRIMLAIKTVLADNDNIDTLIFDEIDTGISGRTAQKVSEKMALISKNHQLICITHLPQIAAMADKHFIIEKSVEENKTHTNVRKLNKEEEIMELARMLGGVTITDTTRENAREMKELANSTKYNGC